MKKPRKPEPRKNPNVIVSPREYRAYLKSRTPREMIDDLGATLLEPIRKARRKARQKS
jgi:hypothetical protein